MGDWRFHDLRHQSSTEALNRGVPEQVVCQIAGWTSGNMIRRYYKRDGVLAVQQFFDNRQSETGHPTGHLQAGVN